MSAMSEISMTIEELRTAANALISAADSLQRFFSSKDDNEEELLQETRPLTLEDVRAAVFGRLARKHDKLRGLASPCIQIGIETVDGSLIEYAFSQDGIILANSKFDGSPSPSWKTDYTVYEALTGEW